MKNEVYASAVVDAEKSPVTISDLEFDKELHIRKNDTTFLQAIVLGPKSLYYYRDINGKDQFYIGNGSGFELLLHKKYLKRYQDRKVINENNTYQDQLQRYLQDCKTIYPQLANTYYDKKRLLKLFLDYYNCASEKLNYQTELEKVSVDIGVLAGVSLSTIVFPGEEYFYTANADYTQSTDFTAGMFLDLKLSRSQGKLSVYNELLYTSYNVEGEYEDIRSNDLYDQYYSEIGFSHLKLNSMLRYVFLKRKVAIFANAGVSLGFGIRKKDVLTRISTRYSNVTTTIGPNGGDDPLRKNEQAWLLGIGAKYKRYSFEFRYENGNGVSDYVPSYSQKIYFLVGYRL